MAKRNQVPEEFIRDLIKRGFTREQILSRATKKDQGFYRLVIEILNHTTLIDKIERQVDGIQQSQINFEKQSYSSKTILDDIEKRKVIDKEQRPTSRLKDNGKANLPVHTDLDMNDLDAPLPDIFKVKKTAFTISTNKKENVLPNEDLTLFDEVQPETTPDSNLTTSQRKLLLYPKVQKEMPETISSDETSKLPESKIVEILEHAEIEHEPVPEVIAEEKSTYDDLEKDKLLIILKQKELMLATVNKTLGNKEASHLIDRKIAKEIKTKQAEAIKDLKHRSSIYRMGLYVAAGLFICTIGLIKVTGGNATETTPNRFGQNGIVKGNSDSSDNNSSFLKPTPPIDFATPEEPIVKICVAPPSPSEIKHLVKKGETFWKITGMYLGKENSHLYKKLMKYNGITKENAPVGKTLIIPTLAELEEN